MIPASLEQEGRLNVTFGNLPEKPDVKIYYDRTSVQAESVGARPVVPSGFYAIRQREAVTRQF